MASCEKCAMQLDASAMVTGKDSPLCQHKRSCPLTMSHRCRYCQKPLTRAGSRRHHERYTCWKPLENGQCMDDFKCYPCQCGKVFSHKDGRLRHQRACPKRSDSQFLQLGSYVSGELSPKASSTPSLPRMEAKSQSAIGTSKTYDLRFRVLDSMEIVVNLHCGPPTPVDE